jgi:hypothetical protein
MRIRRSSDLEERARSTRAPMSVDEFLARFPEVPRDVRDEPTLQEFTRAFGPLLRVAQKPTPCMRDGGDAPHVFYMRLVNDLAIYGIGLAKRDRTLARLSRAPSCPGGRRARLARAAPSRPEGSARSLSSLDRSTKPGRRPARGWIWPESRKPVRERPNPTPLFELGVVDTQATCPDVQSGPRRTTGRR